MNTVIQSRKEFQKPVWIAFVDLKAAFDSVDRKALWKLLRSLGHMVTWYDQPWSYHVRRPRACGTRVLSLRYFLVFSRLLLISDDDLQCDVSIVT